MDSTWGTDATAELDEQLAVITGSLQRIQALPWWRLGNQRLLEATRQIETLSRTVGSAQIRVTAEVDERKLAADHAVPSTAKLLTQLLAITPGEARGRVIAAGMLLPTDPDPNQPDPDDAAAEATPPVLPQLAAAVDAGQVGADHTRVITRTMRAMPDRVAHDVRDGCEQLLVDQARILDANRLRDVAEQVRNITDPDGTLNDLSTPDRTELFIGSRRGDGLTPLRGLLDDLAIERLRQAIEPLAKPQPGGAGEPDPRPAATRRAQALAEVIRRYLTTDKPPTAAGGVRPHAGIIIDLDTLQRGARGSGHTDFLGALSAPLARLLACDAAISVQLATRRGHEHNNDAEAAAGNDDGMRRIGGCATGTITSSNNTGGSGNSSGGGNNSGSSGGAGWNGRRIVDAHPEQRLFTTHQRRALAARDGGCAWPGCDTPPGWTIAHHIRFVRHEAPVPRLGVRDP